MSSEICIIFESVLKMAVLCGPAVGSNTSTLSNVWIKMCNSRWHIVDNVEVRIISWQQCWNLEKKCVKRRVSLYIWTVSGRDDIGVFRTVQLRFPALVIEG